MRRPLRRQILVPMVGIILLTMGLASALGAWLASQQVQRRLEQQLADVASTLSASNFPLESNVLKHTRGLTGAEYVLADRSGRVAAATEESLLSATGDLPASATSGRLTSVIAAGRQYYRATVPIDRRPVGGQVQILHMFYPAHTWREARWQATWPPLAIGGAACLLVAVAAFAVAARVTQPIERLRTQVDRIAQGDFQAVPTPARNDEVRDLATAVNQMAERLTKYEVETRHSERLQTLGTLGGGIAHQIRNAATGCRIALDLHQRDCPLGAGGDDESLVVAVRQLELIETYVKRFMTLGRPAAVETVKLEIGEVIRQAIALVAPMALHSGSGVHTQVPAESLMMQGNIESLGQMLVNLLVNAVQATAQARVLVGETAAESDQQIVVRLDRSAADRCRIAIGDPGPGPNLAIQPRLFEPFATDKAGGTGLGLVVARQIAEDHGGRIWWQRRDEWTWFIVELPLASDSNQQPRTR